MSVDRTHQPLKLRPYQREALDALDNAWSGARRPSGTGVVTRPAVVLPTGMGKTVIFAELIARALSKKQRPLILVHREELAKQAAEKIHSAVPGASIGIVKADRNETGADIIVGSVQTLAKPARREQVRDIGLGIVDECHHAAARTWRETMAYFGAWDRTPWAGFTATMSRSDGGHLGDIWEEVVIKRDIMDGIRGGYLVNVKGKRIKVMDLDLDEVKRSRGDMQAGDLGDAMMDADAGNTIAKACREHAADRQGVIFAPTVPTAYQFAQDMRDAGFTCEVIEGDTPEDERTAIYERYRTGATQWLSNCMVLTEGWDAPWSSCAVIARPTESAALYIQMVGRVLRPWAAGGKTDALVLDVVGVSERHRLATMADLTTSPVRPPRDDDDEWSLSDEVESVESAKARPVIRCTCPASWSPPTSTCSRSRNRHGSRRPAGCGSSPAWTRIFSCGPGATACSRWADRTPVVGRPPSWRTISRSNTGCRGPNGIPATKTSRPG